MLKDDSVLYEDLYRFIKSDKKTETKISFHAIEGLFKYFFIDEPDKNPLTFGTWNPQTTTVNSINTDNSARKGENFSTHKKVLMERSWSLFTFWESHDEKDPRSRAAVPGTGGKLYGIRQSIVKFADGERIKVGNITEDDQVSYYEGKYHLREENEFLYLETKPLTVSSERYFRLMLYFGKKQISEIALGVYYNVRKLGSLLCGSALLIENPTGAKDDIEATGCIIYDRWDSVPAEFATVRQYLERRSLNYIKLPSKIDFFRLDELQETLDNLKEKESEWDYRLHKYDYFLSVPLTYNNSADIYDRNSGLAEKLIALLKEQYPNSKYYCACEKVKTLEDYKNLSDKNKYKKALEAIEQSRNFVWLYPRLSVGQSPDDAYNHHISSAIIELGYAMGLKKPIVIFHDHGEEVHLPNILNDYKPLIKIPFSTESASGIERSFRVNIDYIKADIKIFSARSS